jgi:hypothetical protein
VSASPSCRYAADDPRDAQAIALKRENPKWSAGRIAAAVGIGRGRCQELLAEAGIGHRRPGRPPEPMEAPAWFDRPCGRVQALRRAHGIDA